jgi:hypothetical protein
VKPVSLQLVRADGVRIPPFRVNPLHSSSLIGAAMRVMVAEAGTPFAHDLLFIMQDGSRVTAKPKAA